jgi:hypothetical protein
VVVGVSCVFSFSWVHFLVAGDVWLKVLGVGVLGVSESSDSSVVMASVSSVSALGGISLSVPSVAWKEVVSSWVLVGFVCVLSSCSFCGACLPFQ